MSYQTEVLADNPYLYWRLDELSGTNADDSGPNNRDGTYNGTPVLAQGPLITQGSSVLFTDAADFVLNTATVNLSTATVEVWFEYDGVPPGAGLKHLIAGFDQGGGVGDKQIAIDQNNKANFYVFDSGGQKVAVGSTTLGSGTYHLVGVIDDPNNVATIYVNGVSDGTISADQSYSGYTLPNVKVAGDSAAGFGAHTKAGRRDEFAVYDFVLSAPRILAHYQAGIEAQTVQVLSMQAHVFGHNMW